MRGFVAVQVRDNLAGVSTIGDTSMGGGQQLDERRLAMRREKFEKGGIPFQENLVFHAPLEYGDTTDNVSGTDVTVISPGVLSYDQNKSMYLFSATTSGRIFANLFYWNTPELGIIGNSSTVDDIHYTVHFNVVFTLLGYYNRALNASEVAQL